MSFINKKVCRRQQRRASWVLLISLVILNSSCVWTKERATSKSLLDTIFVRGEIRVGMTADYKPFSYLDQSQPQGVAGLDVELAKELARSLGVKLTIVRTSWPTLTDDLKSRKYDIAMSGITIKLDRQRVGLFSIPVMLSGKAAITRKENLEKFRTIDAINTKGTKVIVNPGGTNESFARANFPNATIVENGENLTVFEKIRDGEADLMVTDAIETVIQEKVYPELVAVNPDEPFNRFELAFLMGRDHTFKAYVDQWFHRLEITGEYQQMLDQAILRIVNEQSKRER